MRCDLHMHSTASDGIFSPGALVEMAKEIHLDYMALTDHDTLKGVPEAKEGCEKAGIHFIPGVEISAGGEQEIHLLGYGVSPSSQKLHALFDRMHEERIERAKKMMNKLSALHMPLNQDEILLNSNGSVGRPHIARAMMKNGYVDTVQEAFEKYIGRGCPAYVAREEISMRDVIRLLREEKAVPVLAHPIQLNWPMEKFLPMLRAWIDAGLMGLEVYHPSHKDDFKTWRRIAKNYHLLITGGSDFHDMGPRHGLMGCTCDAWQSTDEDISALTRALNQ